MKIKLLSTIAGVAFSLLALGALASEDKVNVLLFSMPYTQGLKAMEADFEAKTGIKANIEVVGQDVFENRITLSFSGKTGDIDVVHTPAIQMQRWVEAGWLRPITANVEAMKSKDDFLAGPLKSCLVKGEYYALPIFAETGLMAYRKDILAAAGFDRPPKTWEEMLQVSKAINSKETAAVAMRVAPGQGFNMFVFPMIMRAYGGKFFADYPNDMTPVINSAENLKALEVYSSLMNNYGPAGVGNFNFPEVIASIQAGKAAMTVDGTSIIAQLLDPQKSQVADKLGIALPPAGPAGRSPAIAVHGLGIPADAKNPDAAFKFIEWATSEEVLTKIALSQAYPDFTRASVASNSEVQAKYAAIHPDFLKLRVQALNEAIGYYRPLLSKWPEIGAAVGENINSAVNGLKSNEDALKAAEKEMIEILSDN